MSIPTNHLTDEELLSFIDGESSTQEETIAQRHLVGCPLCRKRRADLESVSSELMHLHPKNFDPSLQVGAEQRLRKRLRASDAGGRSHWIPRASTFGWAAAIVILILALAAATQPWLRNTVVFYLASEPKPDHNLTPGATRRVILAEICQQRDGDDDLDPALPPHIQKAVLREYGIADDTAGSYQIDYLINPQLGGTAEISNLWPQPYEKTVWNARVKDALERRANQMVCSNEIDLATAQREIAADWVAAYKKYFHTSRPL